MVQPLKIIKTSGEEEEFSPQKLEQSIISAGGDQETAALLEKEIEAHSSEITSTDRIHEYIYEQLKQKFPPVAARYNLRRAIIELGPTGFPFEKFIGAILEGLGYEVLLNEVIAGRSVNHEVDFVAIEHLADSYMGEVKFHKRPGLKSDVKVALYVKARFDDIKANQAQLPEKYKTFKQAWLITNTKFSQDALRYAQDNNIRIMAWSYPEGEGLGQVIDRLGIHPLTALTQLSQAEKFALLERGIVLCSDIPGNTVALREAGLSPERIDLVLREAEAVTKLEKSL